VAHLINRDELDLCRQVSIIGIVQIVVLVHVLDDGMQFHAACLVQNLNHVCLLCSLVVCVIIALLVCLTLVRINAVSAF